MLSYELLSKDFDDLLILEFANHRVVPDELSLLLVAGVVVVPGLFVIVLVFESFAQGESEVDIGNVRQLLAFQLPQHLVDLVVFEPEYLQVCHAPIGLPEVGFKCCCFAIGA